MTILRAASTKTQKIRNLNAFLRVLSIIKTISQQLGKGE